MNVCIIPARGGSKRVPSKNIRDFCGVACKALTPETRSKLADQREQGASIPAMPDRQPLRHRIQTDLKKQSDWSARGAN